MSLPRSCCLDPVIIPGDPRGQVEYFDKEEKRVKWYHARPAVPANHLEKKTALVLFYDLFGFSLPNPKILADRFADDLGIDVYVPNYIPNPPHIQPFMSIADLYPHQQALSGVTRWKRRFLTAWVYIQALPRLVRALDYWAYPTARQAIEELRETYSNLGALGYCRGGAIVIRLLSEQTRPITCGMINHPGPINMREWETIDVPTKWHLADEDSFIKDDQIGRLVQLAEEKKLAGIDLDFTLHPETTHGFASRPNSDHPPSKAAYEAVNADVVRFFGKHLLGKTS
ncbi:Alpha/Beta hydrolase protein [Papiliotrema laurentii]|uniref:Alpha/Beta hydrolase protein n=1 Tax=Papiliotrema laurentii TaxID=5418 RepID=A0AAD9CZP2_PAPLA|nr:Alpha/Beta hydrolase protein [Papiliotrema laurentii]